MAKIIPFNNNQEDEDYCDCPTCDMIEHFTNILENADISEFRDIVEVIVHQAKELADMETLISEIEFKKHQLHNLIHGECTCDDDDCDLH